MVFGVILAAVGIGMSMYGSRKSSKAARRQARENARLAEIDVKNMLINKRSQEDVINRDGRTLRSDITYGAGGSGVGQDGSVLEAIKYQTEQTITSINQLGIEVDANIASRRAGAAMEIAKARDRGKAAYISAASQSIGIASNYYGSTRR